MRPAGGPADAAHAGMARLAIGVARAEGAGSGIHRADARRAVAIGAALGVLRAALEAARVDAEAAGAAFRVARALSRHEGRVLAEARRADLTDDALGPRDAAAHARPIDAAAAGPAFMAEVAEIRLRDAFCGGADEARRAGPGGAAIAAQLPAGAIVVGTHPVAADDPRGGAVEVALTAPRGRQRDLGRVQAFGEAALRARGAVGVGAAARDAAEIRAMGPGGAFEIPEAGRARRRIDLAAADSVAVVAGRLIAVMILGGAAEGEEGEESCGHQGQRGGKSHGSHQSSRASERSRGGRWASSTIRASGGNAEASAG